jgi:hypothetical protein
MRSVVVPVIILGMVRRLITSYIDPNTGGMLFQMLAVLFGLLSGALLFFSSQIRMLFARLRRRVRASGRGSTGEAGEGGNQ